MKMSKMFPSKYLKSADLAGKRIRLVIDDARLEEVGADKDQKPVLYFQRAKKGMVLNVTNGNLIAAAYGDDSKDWKGKPVELYVAKVRYQGKMVDGLHVSIPEGAVEPEPVEEEPPLPTDEELEAMGDDDPNIPF